MVPSDPWPEKWGDFCEHARGPFGREITLEARAARDGESGAREVDTEEPSDLSGDDRPFPARSTARGRPDEERSGIHRALAANAAIVEVVQRLRQDERPAWDDVAGRIDGNYRTRPRGVCRAGWRRGAVQGADAATAWVPVWRRIAPRCTMSTLQVDPKLSSYRT
jgi:hypothetical protein